MLWSMKTQYMTILHLQSRTENFLETLWTERNTLKRSTAGPSIWGGNKNLGLITHTPHHNLYTDPCDLSPHLPPCTSRLMFIITCPPLSSGWGPVTFFWGPIAIRDYLSIKRGSRELVENNRAVNGKCVSSTDIKTINNKERVRERSGVHACAAHLPHRSNEHIKCVCDSPWPEGWVYQLTEGIKVDEVI